ALFTPTGSMANVLAVASLVQPGQEVLCEASAHIARAELGAHGAFTGLTMRTWRDPRGQVDLGAIQEMYAPDMGPFFVRTTAVSVENTHNFAGGTVLPIEDLQALRSWADEVGVGLHLDGARLWNAHVATGVPLTSYGDCVDVLSVCLSKGLGAPVGSLIVGTADPLAEAAVTRAARAPSPRRGCAGSGWVAACARSASWPRPGCTRWTTTSSAWPTTTPMPGCSPRPAVSTRPPSTPTSWWCRATTRRRSSTAPAKAACWSRRSAHASYAWSPT